LTAGEVAGNLESIIGNFNERFPMGKVYIIGAGPGSVCHLTLRAQQLLREAEVVIYDALVDDGLLQNLAASCDRIYVGKRGGQPSLTQTEINRILVEQALGDASRPNRTIVRLKSGDPFIFGRTTSEMDALAAADCEYEVVPGLSSALAAPLLAGIPLTDPVLSYGFVVVTAHAPEELHWDALVQIPTLVVLMGTSTLPRVVKGLLQHGRAPQTPIAIIQWASLPQQRVIVGELSNIVATVGEQSLSPAVIVVGEVVKLRQFIRSDRRAPLSGKTILITRSLQQSTELQELLTAQGARTIEMPTLEIGPPSSWAELDRSIQQLRSYQWLILTSVNGVDAFFARLAAAQLDSRALAGIKIAVVGRKTAASLQQYGIQADFIPPNFIADSLVEHFPETLAEQRILFPRVESGGRELLAQSMTASGATVEDVAAYESICPSQIDPTALAALCHQEVQIITFASSKTVRHFHQLIGDRLPAGWLEQVKIASIGPQTSATCRELLGKVDIEATEYTMAGLVEAIMANASTAKSQQPISRLE
jgi:uroporphyrinogen III methyltransferase / synthase